MNNISQGKKLKRERVQSVCPSSAVGGVIGGDMEEPLQGSVREAVFRGRVRVGGWRRVALMS